ncbi:uncharacterized [Tachysurus ichikawai]
MGEFWSQATIDAPSREEPVILHRFTPSGIKSSDCVGPTPPTPPNGVCTRSAEETVGGQVRRKSGHCISVKTLLTRLFLNVRSFQTADLDSGTPTTQAYEVPSLRTPYTPNAVSKAFSFQARKTDTLLF